jgi:magnesium-transporting ATPase (P-type)
LVVLGFCGMRSPMDKVFHRLSAEDSLAHFQSGRNGLSQDEVLRRRMEYGPNVIPQPGAKTLVQIFFHQFLSPLIYVLIAAAIISAAIGDLKDTIFITAIIVINAVLGTYQEWKAENSALALRNLVKVKCRVRREGRISNIDSEDLVPGDIVLLESGQKVPADLRLIEVNDLSVEEALLTGESIPVNKTSDILDADPDLPIGDRINMVFAATTVQRGRALAIVATTGMHTEIGRIADSLRTTESEKPPLVKRMEVFSRKISLVILGSCFILGLMAYYQGMPVVSIFFLMVAVGVSAIPEGLPVGLTVALSIGTRRMAGRNVIVRKLPAVEGLGSCTLIASDKTGTLTMDQQSVKKLYLPAGEFLEVSGQGYNGEGSILSGTRIVTDEHDELHRLIRACVIANEGVLKKNENGWEYSGDAVDVAFRALSYKVGKSPGYFQEKVSLERLIPYESENKFSAAYFKESDNLHFVMKGAVEIVIRKLSSRQAEHINSIAEQMASEGYRVMAVAGAHVKSTDITLLPGLQLLGLIGMIDPLRAEAQDAVHDCRSAGIEVVMITGDHPATALSIARQLNIASDHSEVMTGSELTELKDLSPSELGEKLRGKKVFARVAPLQKQQIVEAKKTLGHYIAVTGDGANDAPALKSAHIGVAMGGGTDLAKEAASIIITDNNFASIAAGVEEGRNTFDNLRKIIYLLISTGAAELLTIALAILMSVPLPFIAVQLLWLNLVTNGIQDIALAFEKGNKEVMLKPPRKPDESIFDKQMISQIIVSGAVIGAMVFALWYHLIFNLAYEEKHARTVVMMLMVLLQNFHALNCRSETKSVFRIPLKNNYILIIGILLAQLAHVSASYIPGLNEVLQLDHITFNEWIKLLPTAAAIFVIMELFKLWQRRKRKLTGALYNS